MHPTDVAFSTYILTAIQFTLLPFQLIYFLTRRFDKTRLRFLVLSLLFVAFNLVWILFECTSFATPDTEVNTMIFFGITVAAYHIFYLTKELGIQLRYINHKTIFIGLILAYSLPFLIQQATTFATYDLVFTVLAQLLALIFSISSLQNILNRTEAKTPIIYASIVGIAIITFLPIAIYLQPELSWKNLYINAAYYPFLFAYFFHYVDQSKFENKALNKIRAFSSLTLKERYAYNPNAIIDVELTPTEKEIVRLMLLDYTHREIGEHLFLATNSITSYASKIYKKTGCKSKEELIEKYFSNRPTPPHHTS